MFDDDYSIKELARAIKNKEALKAAKAITKTTLTASTGIPRVILEDVGEVISDAFDVLNPFS